MTWAIAGSASSRKAFAALGVVAAAGLSAASAEAQALEPLPPLPPGSYLIGASPSCAATSDPSEAAPPAPAGATPQAPPSAAPPAPPGATPPAPPEAPSPMRFDPDQPDVGLLNRTGAMSVGPAGWDYYERRFAPVYTSVCEGPCTTRLPSGPYRFALVKGGRVVPASESVVLEGPATLRGHYVDRSGLRAAGLAVGIAGAIGGFVMIVASARSSEVCDASGFCSFDQTADGPLLGAGIGVLVGSAILGSILTFQRDAAHVTVEPLSLPSGRAGREAPLLALGTAPLQGAAVALHF